MTIDTITSQILAQLVNGVLIIDDANVITYANDWILQRVEQPERLQGMSLMDTFPELQNSRLEQTIIGVICNK